MGIGNTEGSAGSSLRLLPPGLKISLLTQQDVQARLPAIAALGADESWLDWEAKNYLAELPGKWRVSLQAEFEGELAAYAICSLRGNFIWVHRLVTGNSHRGKGIGAAVLRELSAEASKLGLKGLLLKTPAGNARALQFYMANGFTQYAAERQSACLRRLLPEHSFTVAIHQPNYIPWLGYFYKIFKSDCFVFLDDVSFPTRSFVNRNRVCINASARWLTIPIRREFDTIIRDAVPAEPGWHKSHLRSLELSYKRAPHFGSVFPLVASVLEKHGDANLGQLNSALIECIARHLEIGSSFLYSSSLPITGSGEDRILNLVKAVGGQTYISGSGAAGYQSGDSFRQQGIELQYSNFTPSPYPQQAAEFLPGLSILDALFNVGRDGIRASFEALQAGSESTSPELAASAAHEFD
jgi:GNAT superfamily N-acetyltransferase